MFDDSHADWAQVPAGPELATALERVEVGRLSGFGLVEVVKASERLRSWVTAVQCEAMAELAHCADEALAETSPNPHARTATVNDIAVEGDCHRAGRRPADRRAPARNRARPGRPASGNPRRVEVRSDTRGAGQDHLPAHRRARRRRRRVSAATGQVERRVLVAAPGQTPGRLRAIVDRAVQRADPGAASERHRRAESERRIEVWPQPDGMATLAAILPADRAHVLYGVVDAFARTLGSEDPRSMDRRADCLVDLVVNGGDVTSDDPLAGLRRPTQARACPPATAWRADPAGLRRPSCTSPCRSAP